MRSIDDSPQWYGIRVKSNFEQSVAGILTSKGYEQFLPLYRLRRRWSDRLKETRKPLFTGYVFCRMSIQERLPVLMTPGVVGVVGAGKTPIAIPMEEIESLQVMVNSNLFLKPWPFLQPGQRVRILRGPLADLEGDLVKVKNELRFVVSVRLLQRSVAAEVDADWLEPLAPIMRCGLHESPGNRLAATPLY